MSGAVSEDIERLAGSRIGQTLRGKLRLDQLLGVGGSAAVYAATHRTGKRYAVKILHPQLMLDARIRERFFREGYVVNRVEHPAVVGVIDDDVDDDGSIFLVMELLEGETVESMAARRGQRLSLPDVLRIADQTLDVLAAAHARGIVHRDLKPENLFYTLDGRIKVLDFGIARLLELGKRTLATRAGTVIGTPAFMPPEQARGRVEQIDGRSDLWALGATMFTLLTGRLVHEAPTANELLLAAMKTHAPKLGHVMPKIDPEVAAVVDRALEYERDARWPDASAMRAAVTALLDRAPVAISPPSFDPEETTKNDPAAYGETDPAPGAIKLSPSSEITAVRAGSINPFGATELGTPCALLHRTHKESLQPVAKLTPDTDEMDKFPSSAEADSSRLAQQTDAFVRRGVARTASGDYAGAQEDFTAALDLTPGCVIAYYNRGAVRYRRADYEGSLVDYGDALALTPEFPEARFNRALCLQKIGKVPEAQEEALSAAALYEAEGRKSEADAARLLGRALWASDTLQR